MTDGGRLDLPDKWRDEDGWVEISLTQRDALYQADHDHRIQIAALELKIEQLEELADLREIRVTQLETELFVTRRRRNEGAVSGPLAAA